ncbi:MAG: DegT/DnrJ/EryC1/StrS family aminotransferase [Candidatus Auribacterota bacterium]|jgi:dTDP-4-amino-4,6-dideoxygalactose transaminase|nr:DegT/DnrJ/EryC1/StrS family aminotransferase [Candidatus Auribacterota bacterium]
MQVPLLDVKAQNDDCRQQMLDAIINVVDSGKFIMGPEVQELESRITKRVGVRFAIGCASGTDALLLALRALNVGYADEVITTPFTFFATAGAVANVGATPVFVDIDRNTFNIDPKKIEEKISSKTKCIIAVHLFGQCADMSPIVRIAEKHGLKIIEDAAQSLGARYDNTPAGALGDVACFSFYPSKNLGGIGDGGMITTSDPDIAQKVTLLRNHGSPVKYYHSIVGTNSRLDTLQAAALLVKLDRLSDYETKRRNHAQRYIEAFSSIDGITVPFVHNACYHVFNQFTIMTAQRDELRRHLTERQIGTDIYYPKCLHLQDCFSGLNYKQGDMPAAEQAAQEVLSIPVYPELSVEQQDYVIDSVTSFFTSAKI